MQDVQKFDNVVELKDDLCTVVDALGILQDFIESVFGAKFQSFCDDQHNPNNGNRVENKDPREALRQLRWKNSSRGLTRKLSETAISSEFNRSSSSTEGVASMICEPEIINVKCEINPGNGSEEVLPDFLDDVDPFSGHEEVFHYEGDSEVNISSSFETETEDALQQQTHQQKSQTPQQQQSPDNSSFKGNTNNINNLGSRFIPGLIPIQPDPLTNADHDSESNSSEANSDKDWHPSSSSIYNKKKETSKKKRKRTAPAPAQLKRSPSNNISNSNKGFPSSIPQITTKIVPVLIGKTSIHAVPTPIQAKHNQQHSNQHHPGGFSRSSSSGSSSSSPGLAGSEGGPFKCTMCSASYKQEESLKSHQKYKHNPSRVQCQCPLCGKSMVDKYRLQRHLRLHTGEKPFECQYCGQSFYRKDYHTKHMQRKHNIHSSTSFPTTTSTSSTGTNSPSSSGAKTNPKKTQASHVSTSTPYSTPSTSSSGGVRPKHNVVNTSSASTPLVRDVSIIKQEIASNVQETTHVTTSSSGNQQTPSTTATFMDYFSGFSSGLVGGGENVKDAEHQDEASSTNSLGISSSSLMTMTSLTFDDLISADL